MITKGRRKPASHADFSMHTFTTQSHQWKTDIEGARVADFPRAVPPMLANNGKHVFKDEGWLYEPKLDGIRAIVVARNGQIELQSRRGLVMTRHYPTLCLQLAAALPVDCVIDGEIVAFDETGTVSFEELQSRINLTQPKDIAQADRRIPVSFYAFDAIHVQSMSLLKVPLQKRKLLLAQLLKTSQQIDLISYWEGNGEAVFEACMNLGHEGVVAKRLQSFYEPGKRSDNWIKIKPFRSAEFVVAGYKVGQGNRDGGVGSLMLGQYNQAGELVYMGSVGTGFSDRQLDEMIKTVQPLRIKNCPFNERPREPQTVWLTPRIVAEVKYMMRTRDGKLRAPVFLRFRPDLHAQTVLYL